MRAALLASTALVACADAAVAVDATWNLNGTGDYHTATNWTPAAVPNAVGTAFFGVSNQNVVGLSPTAATVVRGWTFNTDASAYTFINNRVLNFNGPGIVINGGSASISNNFVLNFNNASTAGSANITNTRNLNFHDNSTAGNAIISNNLGTLQFEITSTAGNANISNSSILSFFDASMAGSATITNNASGSFNFNNNSSAASATITNNGPLNFNGNSTAGSAIITNNGDFEFQRHQHGR